MVPDTARRYGTVSRTLHWGMALLFAWMFFTAIVHAVAEKSALDKQLFVTHKQVGSLLMVLVLVRAAWALAHRRQRPPELNAAALVGQVTIYVLMFAVPAVALLRQYGSGRAFSPLGLPLMPGFDPSLKIQWMVDAGRMLHANLAWGLLALVVGHAGMALLHRRHPGDDVLPRMIGQPAR